MDDTKAGPAWADILGPYWFHEFSTPEHAKSQSDMTRILDGQGTSNPVGRVQPAHDESDPGRPLTGPSLSGPDER